MKKLLLLFILTLAICLPLHAGGPTPLQSAVSSFWAEFGSDAVYTEKSVGIGTTTPDVNYMVDIASSSKKTIGIDSNDPNNGIYWRNSADPLDLHDNSSIRADINGGLHLYNRGYDTLFIGASDVRVSRPMYLYYQLLSYNGSAASPNYAFNSSLSTGLFYGGSANTMGFSNNGIETMRTTADNNVLIGDTTDDGVNKLQVTGNAKVTGDLEVASANGMVKTMQITLADDASVDVATQFGLTTDPLGLLRVVMLGGTSARGSAYLSGNGDTVTVDTATTFVNTDTDTNLCLFPTPASTGNYTLRNRTGGSRTLLITWEGRN